LDPIIPIVPGPSPISARLPVEPLERISRERDRPPRERRERGPREPSPPLENGDSTLDPAGGAESGGPRAGGAEGFAGDDDGERPHVDVRA